MGNSLGTRTQQNVDHHRQEGGSETRSHTRDVGMSKRRVASLVYGTLLVSSALVSAAGTGYVPADTITLAGSANTAAILAVATTKVVSATVQAGGSGGTPGTQTVTGTTGTGTKFQASVTVSGGGAITAVLAISVAGSYTANPSNIAQEPVTGASLSGAKLTVVMGVDTVTVSTAGAYGTAPANPVAQGATSGAGTGATFTASYAAPLAQILGATNDFTSFALNDPILVEGTNLNNGAFTVTGLDAVNHAYLTVDPPPKSEGPVSSTVRTV